MTAPAVFAKSSSDVSISENRLMNSTLLRRFAHRVSSTIGLLFLWSTVAFSEPYLQVSVDEIGSASPIRALAVMPVRLATAAYNAVPESLHKDALKEGFDLKEISQKIEKLQVGQSTTFEQQGITVKASKLEREPEEPKQSSYLVVKIDKTEIACPLAITTGAVKILTFVFKDLQPVAKQLEVAINEAKNVPPSRLLWCTDQERTLEVSLK